MKSCEAMKKKKFVPTKRRKIKDNIKLIQLVDEFTEHSRAVNCLIKKFDEHLSKQNHGTRI